MKKFVGLVLAIIAVGAAAGWFLTFWAMLALTACGAVALLWLGAQIRDSAGTSGGIAIGLLQIAVVLFLVAMWGSYAASSVDWAHLTSPINWSSIRQLLFRK